MILPITSALTLTCVFGSIFPGARTRAVMSSDRPRANCTGVILERLPRATAPTTSSTVTSTPIPIHSHLFLMRRTPDSFASIVPPAHPSDPGIGHPYPGARHDALVLGTLQLHLRVDQIQNCGRSHVVLLLSQLEVLRRRFDGPLGHVDALESLVVAQQRLTHFRR